MGQDGSINSVPSLKKFNIKMKKSGSKDILSLHFLTLLICLHNAVNIIKHTGGTNLFVRDKHCQICQSSGVSIYIRLSPKSVIFTKTFLPPTFFQMLLFHPYN